MNIRYSEALKSGKHELCIIFFKKLAKKFQDIF